MGFEAPMHISCRRHAKHQRFVRINLVSLLRNRPTSVILLGADLVTPTVYHRLSDQPLSDHMAIHIFSLGIVNASVSILLVLKES